MPDTLALMLAIAIIGAAVVLAAAILFGESRGRQQRSIEHYRRLERERSHRMRRFRDDAGVRPSWDRYMDNKNQRAA